MLKRTLVLLFLILAHFMYAADNRIIEVLNELDSYIEKRTSFETDKNARIENLEKQFEQKNLSLNARYTLCADLYTEYRSYKYDSAYSKAEQMLYYAQKLQEPNLVAQSKIALSFSCISAGLFKEATEISSSINTSELGDSTKATIFSFLSMLYMNMADFSPNPYYDMYRSLSLEYCEKFIAISQDESTELIIIKSRKHQLENNYDSARIVAENYLNLHTPTPNDKAILLSMLAYFYQIKGDTIQALTYFSRAAIVDIKMATKETSAIRQTAELLYSMGDIQHAYSYAMVALEDANFYNARHRKIEVGRILPIIDEGRFAIIKQQKDRLLIFSGIISVLFVLFLIATFIIIKQNKKISFARRKILQQNNELLRSNQELTSVQKKISKQNIDLIQINKKLKEAHHIKEEYIGYFFSNSSTFIEKLDDYRKTTVRKIRQNQHNELIEMALTSDIRKDREDLFVLFDRIFTKIFPDFVDRYNELFNEEDRVIIKADGILTNEIRIFALIRLGITESERIANFLNFSLSTIKNYKTKTKNKSWVANEQFETKIMEIESVKTDITEQNG